MAVFVCMYSLRMTHRDGAHFYFLLYVCACVHVQTPAVSMVYTQMEILNKEVFLVSQLEELEDKSLGGGAGSNSNAHLKAVCFVRPSAENVRLLARQLRAIHGFAEYHIYFTNAVRDGFLQELADADEHERVRVVQEVFCDYLILDRHLFTVPVNFRSALMRPVVSDRSRAIQNTDRIVEGIASLLLTLKRRAVIRYSANSDAAELVANNLWHLTYQQERALFDYRAGESYPVVLIVDRRDDPVTPLLSQWTYQAMVHELFDIKNNRVSLHHLPKVPKDQRDLVLSGEQDEFFRSNMYLNYGDLGANMKEMADDYMASKKTNSDIQSIEDMQRFLENYPEFRQKSVTVSKHLTLLTELSRVVDERSLMAVSGMEQDLACSQLSIAAASDGIEEVLSNPSVGVEDALRLALIFALRYEGKATRELGHLRTRLDQRGATPQQMRLLETIVECAGSAKRTGDLFGDRTFLKRASKMAKTIRGVENVYTQHQPLLTQTIEDLVKNRLRESDFPFSNKPGSLPMREPTVRFIHSSVPDLMSCPSTTFPSRGRKCTYRCARAYSLSLSLTIPVLARAHMLRVCARPVYFIRTLYLWLRYRIFVFFLQEVIVFVIGGATYEESREVSLINTERETKTRIFLGGTSVQSSKSFLHDLVAASSRADDYY